MIKFTLTAIFILTGFAVCSQSVSRSLISSGGNEFITPNVSGSFSIGQTATTTFSSSALTIIQGYQQNEVEVPVTGLYSIDLSQELIVYPNPAENIVQFKIPKHLNSDFILKGFDIHGRELKEKISSITQDEYRLDVSQLSVGAYIFKLTSKDQKYFGLVRIIKNR